MADALKIFKEGEDILASETNDNNQFLLSKLSENAAQVQDYVEGEITSIKSNVASVQATLQSNIDKVANQFELNALYITLTINGSSWSKEFFSDKQKTKRVWCEMGGVVTDVPAAGKTVTLPKKFSNTNYYINCNQPLEATYSFQTFGITAKTTASFTVTQRNYNMDAGVCSSNWFACGV